MEQFSIEKINPTKAAVAAAAEAASKIVVTDLKDKSQLAVASTERKKLKALRVEITKTGKDARDEVTRFTKAVIAYEKELVAVIEPEELRLEAYEEEAKQLAIREERERKLPERMKRLSDIGHDGVNPDTVVIMDDVAFEAEFNRFVAYNNEQAAKKLAVATAALEKEKRDREDALAAVQREKDERDREEKRVAEREAAVKEAEERGRRDAEAKAKADAERTEREAKEKADAEAKEQAAMEGKKKFQRFLEKHGVNEMPPTYPRTDRKPPTFISAREQDGTYALYKLVDTIAL